MIPIDMDYSHAQASWGHLEMKVEHTEPLTPDGLAPALSFGIGSKGVAW